MANDIEYLDISGLGQVWNKVKGIVNPKADKDTNAVEGNVPVFDANGNPVDSGAALNAILSAIQLLASGPQYNPGSQSVIFPVSSSAQYNASARSVSFSTLNV